MRPSSGREDREAGSSSVVRKRSSQFQGKISVTSVHPAWSAETRAGLDHRPCKEGPPLELALGPSPDGGHLTPRPPRARCQDSGPRCRPVGGAGGVDTSSLRRPCGRVLRAGASACVTSCHVMPRPRGPDSRSAEAAPVRGPSLVVDGCPF